MSKTPMTQFERTQRSLARSHGALAREYIVLAAPWNQTGGRFVDGAYFEATRAAHHAGISIAARDRRERRRKRR
jgi:hypothetical protein